MLTKTSETAIKMLVFIALHGNSDPIPPKTVAKAINASPTYLSKINSLLVKAGILKSYKGIHGGVMLSHPTTEITLLSIIEACQGLFTADYCAPVNNVKLTCGFHQAMYEIHYATRNVLSRWTLADMARQASPQLELDPHVVCKMSWRK